jgi:uncharacterized protein involved in outer membrane biogenesis
MHKRLLCGLVLGLSGILVLVVLNINFMVRRNQEYQMGEIGQALGRKVFTESVEVTLWPVGARFVNFAVAADPDFAATELLRARNLRIDFEVWASLLGLVRFKKVVLESPVITLVRDERGRYNVTRPADNGTGGGRNSAAGGKKTSAEQQGDRLLLVERLTVSDGTFRYRDLKSRGELSATRIDLEVKDFKWDEPFEIQLEAAVMAASQNLRLKTWLGPLSGNATYADVPLNGEIHAEALDLGKINAALPQFRNSLPRALRFDGVYTIEDLKFKGTWKTLWLKGAVTGTDASFKFE